MGTVPVGRGRYGSAVTVLVPAPARPDVPRTAVAWAPLAVLAGLVAVVLLAVAGRYGYHRDELYFLRAGHEPALGYVDQPPLTPLLARAMDALVPGSVTGLRIPSALSAALVVLLTGLTAREFGAARRGQVLAAVCTAVGAFPLAVGHLLSTTTFDLLTWTALTWLLARALRDGGPVWPAAGLVAGAGLENKWQPAFLLGAFVVGVLAAGPRRALASPWPWLGGALAGLLWVPDLVWQARHGWPQLELSSAIAAGSSGTSEPWYVFLPFQLLLISPLLVPVWAIGWGRLLRSPALRTWRAFPIAYVVLAVFFLATGGKPYYLGGMYPVLLAAGAQPVADWAARGAHRWRTGLLAAAVALSLAVSASLFLPLVPVGRLADTPIVAINYDAGETVAWPRFADAVRAARAQLPAGEQVVVFTQNYGEAGAIDRYAPDLGPAYSGHNSYWSWGPPPETARSAVVVGRWSAAELGRWFGSVRQVAAFDNGLRVDDDEQGVPIWLVAAPRPSWARIWPQLRHLG